MKADHDIEIRDIEIRPASAEDMLVIGHVLGRERARFYRGRLRYRGIVLTCWLSGEPIAAVYVSREPADEPAVRLRLPGVPFVHRLYVRPHLRGRGLGTALLAGAETILRRHGHRRVASGVEPENHRVIAWYRRLGYQEWPYGPVATVREVYRPDGTSGYEPDTCRIFVKEIR